MSYKNERYMKLVKDIEKSSSKKPEVTDKQAEEAFKTILTWIGEDPNREGLIETPKRVVKAFKEYFQGYTEDPNKYLSKTFTEVLVSIFICNSSKDILEDCEFFCLKYSFPSFSNKRLGLVASKEALTAVTIVSVSVCFFGFVWMKTDFKIVPSLFFA